MLALIVSCGLMFWALRVVWENQNPAVRAVKGLDAANAADRLMAVHELQTADPKATSGAIVPLISRLGDAESTVRAAAAEALGTIVAQPGTANSLVPTEARAASAALLKALRDEAPSVRTAAAMSLWSIANSNPPALDFELAVRMLVERLGDPDPVVRLQVVRALAKIGPRAFDDPPPALVAALKDADVSLREPVVNALGGYVRGLHRLAPALVRAVERDGPKARATELELLDRLGPPASDSVVSLAGSDSPLSTGYLIAEAIGRIAASTESSEAAAALAEALSAKSARTREGAINGLQSLAPGSASARARLTEALRHSDREVRAAAETILAKLKPAEG
jgi:HEAT repeat protein